MLNKPIIESSSPSLKLLALGIIILFCLIVVLILGVLIAIPIYGPNALSRLSELNNSTNPETIHIAKYFQIVSQLAIFIIPSVLFALLAGRKPFNYLSLNRKPKIKILFYSIAAILVAIPLINFLGEFNKNIELPQAWSYIEQWIKKNEEAATQLTEIFLNVSTLQGLLVNILMISILPAFGEEMLFRGILQRLFTEWSKNIHISIFLSAFIFSFIHFQFYGFLPRIMLGLLLGYIFFWTGSLWFPVAIHFINNFLAVLVYYFFSEDSIRNVYETAGTSQKMIWAVGLSIIVTSFVLWKIFMYYKTNKANNVSAI